MTQRACETTQSVPNISRLRPLKAMILTTKIMYRMLADCIRRKRWLWHFSCCLSGWYHYIVFSEILSLKNIVGHFVRFDVAPTFWLWLLRFWPEEPQWHLIFKGYRGQSWGTPDRTTSSLDHTPSITTDCVHLMRKAVMQFSTLPLTP